MTRAGGDAAATPFCIIPAAGEGRRFGGAKQLADVHGVPMLERAVREARAAVGERVVVVAGAHLAAVTALLIGLRAPFTVNPDWRRGLGGSIGAGVRALPPDAAAAIVLNADQVRVTRGDLRELVAAWRSEPERIACASFGGNTGPPVIFPARLFSTLAALRTGRGAKAVIDAEQGDVRTVPLPNAATDVDSQQDLAEFRARGGESG